MAESRIYSKKTDVAPYDTFFNDLAVEAYSVFNYYTDDESTNDTLELGNNRLEDMPRFVKVAWDMAPDIPQRKKDESKLAPSQLSHDAKFNGEVEYYVNGVSYKPEQLNPSNFSQILSQLCNSDIAPGVIQSSISLPLDSSGINRSPPPPYRIDKDALFSSPTSHGISYNELRNNFDNRSNPYAGVRDIARSVRKMSREGRALHSGMFGDMVTTKKNFVTKTSTIMSSNSRFGALAMDSNTSLSVRPNAKKEIETMFEEITHKNHEDPFWNRVYVNFVDSGIGNATSKKRIESATDASHANSTIAVASVLKNLIAYSESVKSDDRKITIKSFDAPSGVPRIEYVGYIIEKYEQVNGIFSLHEVIGIPDIYTDEYYDTKVKYGAVYRYRIRSVLRWVRPRNVGVDGTDDTQQSDLTTDRNNVSSINTSPNLASYFGSQWHKKWAVAHIIDDEKPNPPDQIHVRVYSKKRKNIITFAAPDNKQRDISTAILYRKVVNDEGKEIRPWEQLAIFSIAAGGFYYEDRDVSYYQTAQVRYVYAATSVSIHNGESDLSTQLSARLNNNWADEGEFPVEHFSCAGVDIDDDVGVFSVAPAKRHKTHIIVKPTNTPNSRKPANIVITGQERIGSRLLTNKNYLLRIHSLDTGETNDINFDTQVDNLLPDKMELPNNIYIPSANEILSVDDYDLTSDED